MVGTAAAIAAAGNAVLSPASIGFFIWMVVSSLGVLNLGVRSLNCGVREDDGSPATSSP